MEISTAGGGHDKVIGRVNDERIIKALGLSRDEVSKTAPLFQHKDSVALVVKFE